MRGNYCEKNDLPSRLESTAAELHTASELRRGLTVISTGRLRRSAVFRNLFCAAQSPQFGQLRADLSKVIGEPEGVSPRSISWNSPGADARRLARM